MRAIDFLSRKGDENYGSPFDYLSVTLGTNKLVSKMPLLHGITSLSAKVYNLPEKGYCTRFLESFELFQNSNL